METTTITRDNLIAGEFDTIQKTVTVKANEPALKRGTLLTVNGDGLYRKFDEDSEDGSETLATDPVILAHDIAANTSNTTGVLVYLTGEFNKAIVEDSDHTNYEFTDDDILALRDKMIFLNSVY